MTEEDDAEFEIGKSSIAWRQRGQDIEKLLDTSRGERCLAGRKSHDGDSFKIEEKSWFVQMEHITVKLCKIKAESILKTLRKNTKK